MAAKVAFSRDDEKWMDRALSLALQGRGTTRPNPIVGAVLVRGGRVLAEGFHRRAGLPHAEREALAALLGKTKPAGKNKHAERGRGRAAAGATLYVTLEPCCHTGRTPPCTDALIEAGIARVVVGLRDPNPVVNGQGIALLRKAGIRVDVGCRADESRAQNRPFLTWVEHGRPWVTLKVASTLDGFIADWSMPTTRSAVAAPGPVWITGEAAREAAHVLRSEHDAILVGAGTVLADDPQLTVRLPSSKHKKGLTQPLRVVLDGRLRISPGAKILGGASDIVAVDGEAIADAADPPVTQADGRPHRLPPKLPPSSRTLVFSSAVAPRQKVSALEAAGAEVIRIAGQGGRVPLHEVLQALATRGVQSLLVEGGADVHAAFITAGLVDAVAMFQAPLLLGGGVPIARGQGRGVAAALRLGPLDIQQFGSDLCIRAEVLR